MLSESSSTSVPEQPAATLLSASTWSHQTAAETALKQQPSTKLSSIPGIVISDVNRISEDPNVFLTQRAGKISQRPHVVPVVPQEQELGENNNGRTMQATLIVQKKRELKEVEAALEKKRIEFKQRMEECAKKREELRVKQKQIRDRVLKFEKFLRENESKRQRALLKAQTERRFREQKEQELQNLQHLLREYQAKNEQFRSRLGKNQLCERYLASVVSSLPVDYLDVHEPHITDLLMRHKTLRETNEDLRNVAQRNTTLIEKEQVRLNDSIKSHNDNVLTYNSHMSTNQKRMEKLKAQTASLEQRFDQKNQMGLLKVRALGETMLAIENLHVRVLATIAFLAQLRATAAQLQQQTQQQASSEGAAHGSSNSLNASRRKSRAGTASESGDSRPEGADTITDGTESDFQHRSRTRTTLEQSTTLSTTTAQTQSTRHGGGRRKTSAAISTNPPAAPAAAALLQLPQARVNIPWQQKMQEIQNRVIDLTEIAEKAQEFINIEKAKRAEIDKMKQELHGALAKEEKQRERELREIQDRKERQRQKKAGGGASEMGDTQSQQSSRNTFSQRGSIASSSVVPSNMSLMTSFERG